MPRIDGEYALVASMGGASKHPVWYWNLKADPTSILVQDGPEPLAVDVRELIPVFLATRRS